MGLSKDEQLVLPEMEPPKDYAEAESPAEPVGPRLDVIGMLSAVGFGMVVGGMFGFWLGQWLVHTLQVYP